MTGSREKAVIVRCPYDVTLGCELYRPGARLSMPEIMDLVLHFGIPNGTEYSYRGVTYRLYRSRHDERLVRYVLVDGEMLEDSAARVVQDETTSYHAKWRKVPTCTENDSMIHF